MNCKYCKWKHPETCRICRQDEKKQDGTPKPDMTRYGIFYVTKISMN